ncbi:MAG: SPFH domain-containing protein [Spirochaetaceae bacterium]|nr:SPFH domain-containing protein [Spirochaetaceae bacterium]
MSDGTSLPPSTRIIYAVFDYAGQHKTRILAAAVAVAVAALLASGVYVVKKEERGVRVRFGKVITAVVEPGLHYRIPLVESAHVRKVMRIERQRIASQGGDAGTTAFTILSGDTNLLEIDLVVQYRIDSLRDYLYASSDPHRVLALVTREQLVDIVGRNFVDLIFTQNRDYIERHLTEHTIEQLAEHGIGLEIVSLSIVDVRPIAETLPAFRDVNDAIAERMQAVSDANRRREQLLAHTRGQAEALLLDAKAKATERVVQAGASSTVFTALLGEYREQPEQVAITRYWQRMRTIFAEAHLAAVNPDADSTIDINMLDGIATYPPTALPADAMAAAGPGEMADRPLLPTLRPPGMHTIETVEADKPLLDGQFHEPLTERDHGASHPRSLLFDTPSIFTHRHAVTRALRGLRPRAEVPSAAGPADEPGAADPYAHQAPADPDPTGQTLVDQTSGEQASVSPPTTTDKGDHGAGD